MSPIDIVILILFVPFIINGIKNGLVKQATGIASLFIGIFLAYKFSDLVATWLNNWIEAPENVVKIISFTLIMIAVILSISIITKLILRIINIVMMTWLDKLLGFIFSIFAAAMIIGVFISLVDFINESWFTILSKERIEGSVLYPKLRIFSESVFPYLKEFFNL